MTLEIIILAVQIFMFYIFPLLAGPTDVIGMVMIMIYVTFFISIVLGARGKAEWRILYPALIAVIFIPTVYIYYNESALVHSMWYLVVSGVGLLIGYLLKKIIKK